MKLNFMDISFLKEVKCTYLMGGIKGVGQVFRGGVAEFRDKLRKFAIEHGFEFGYSKNERKRVTVFCKQKKSTECQWHIHALKVPDGDSFYIKEYNGTHTCSGRVRLQKSNMMDSSVVSSVAVEKLRSNPSLKPREIESEIKINYGFDISYRQAWRAREAARIKIYSADSFSYNRLSRYVAALRSTNPGTHCVLESDPETGCFKRLFVCFGACMEGFRFCCPMLFLDATFIKNNYKGQLLGATGKNGDQGFYPFAFAIVDSESEENWRWFLLNLSICLSPKDRIYTFISDRNNGLLSALPEIFPTDFHSYCFHHLKFNLNAKFTRAFNKDLRERILKRFGKVAYSPTESGFWYHLQKLNEMEGIRVKLMAMFSNRSHDSQLWRTTLCPVMEDILIQNLNMGRQWKVTMSSQYIFEVDADFRVKVDLGTRCCSCRLWQIKSFPCSHALAAIQQSPLNIYDFIEDWFKASNFKASYGYSIKPVPNIEDVFIDDSDYAHINPPKTKRQPGRRKKRRIANVGENTCTVTCSRCNVAGHNRASCNESI